jgi:hypothetical protein
VTADDEGYGAHGSGKRSTAVSDAHEERHAPRTEDAEANEEAHASRGVRARRTTVLHNSIRHLFQDADF